MRFALFAAAAMVAVCASAAALPTVEGEVRKIDAAKGTIVLKHGEIPNLGMPAMAMEFSADRKLLERFKPGDKVKFQADMVGGKATVVDLKQAKP